MSAKNRIVVLDKKRNVLQNLLENDGLIDTVISRRINGESTLTFKIPKINEKFKSLYELDITLVADGREYTLMKENAITTSKSLDSVTYADVNAVETWYLLNKKYVTAYNSKMLLSNVAFSMVNILSKSTEPLNVNGKIVTSRFPVGSAGYALQALLWDSGWTVLSADNTGQLYDLITDKKTILENVMEVTRLWGGMLFWDSIKKTITFRNEKTYQPENGFQVRYGYNLQEITRQQNNDIATRIIPRGNNYLNIDKVNSGKSYLEDYTYSSNLYEKEIQNPDIYDQKVLLEWGKEQLKIWCKPRYQYTVNTADLSKLVSENTQDIEIGYMCDIVDSDVVYNVIERDKRIIAYSYEMFTPVRCQIEIGDKIGSFEELFRDLTKKATNSDDIIAGDGTIGGDHVNIEDNEDYANFREQYLLFEVETDTEFSNAYAAIELLSSETESKITLLTQYTDKRFVQTEASITALSNATESSITSLTKYTNTEFGKVNTSIASISQTVNSQGSSIKLLSRTQDEHGDQIAEIEISTNKNTSEIRLRATKVYVDAEITYLGNVVAKKINADVVKSTYATISSLNAQKARIDTISTNYLTANKLTSMSIGVASLKAASITLDRERLIKTNKSILDGNGKYVNIDYVTYK